MRCPAACASARRLLRTLLFDTDVILLDEPFGALDAQTKLYMQEWLLGLWADFGKTVVFVTHDVEEAIYLSDEVHVMATRPGRIVETIPVPIARPRQRHATLVPEFIAIKERCLELSEHRSQFVPRRGGLTCRSPHDGAGNLRRRHASRSRAIAAGSENATGKTGSPPAGAERLAAVGYRRRSDRHPDRRHRAVAGGRGLWLDRRVLLVEAERHLRDADQSSSPRATPGPISASPSVRRFSAFSSARRSARCSGCRSGGRAITRRSCSPTSSASNRCRSSRSRRW